MSIVRPRRQVEDIDHPANLTSELAQARQVYEARKANVVQRATARHQAVVNLQKDLDAERVALEALVSDAK